MYNQNNDDQPAEGRVVQPYEYYEQVMVQRVHHFYLSLDIGPAALYTDMIHGIRMASEGEIIVMHLNMQGGNLGTGVQIINAIESSQAHVICSVEGEAHSLGTLIFLSGDEFVVHNNSMMMFHNFSSVVSGKGHEQKSRLEATTAWFTEMARKKYIPFLSEEEFQDMLDGKDLWMQSDEIRNRVKRLGESDENLLIEEG